MWFDDAPAQRVGRDRMDEIQASGAAVVAVACPFCLTMVRDGVATASAAPEVRDVAELLLEATSGHAPSSAPAG
jgi:Fe-S oxidoreductase